MPRRRGASTLAVHAGERYDPATGAVGTPIYQVATFYYPRKPDGRGHWVPNTEFLYTRSGNPTVRAAEDKLAALEGAEEALCFSSGMAAISASTLAFVRPGENLVAQANIYGGTTALFNTEYQRLGLGVRYSYQGEAEELVSLCDEKTRVVFVEAPSNPFGFVVDLPDLAARLKKRFGRRRPLVLIDATTASPANLRPLERGADLSLHSATKYLNGHSDLIAGAAAGSRALIARVRPWLKNLGGSMDPHQAFLLRRGLATLPLRVARHNTNAAKVAAFLEDHPKVERAWHPSLASHPHHRRARRLLAGGGGLVAFQPKTRRVAAARKFLERLELFAAAASLGGVESLVSLPVDTQHRDTPPAMRKKLGITPTLVRLAIGIEDADDLIDDLRQGLRAL